MRYSQYFIPTVKEVPADAEIPSHQLMIRAGLMRRLASGTYNYLPAGLKCLQKVMNIVREEMNRAGALEIVVPIIQPVELWNKSGRSIDYGENLFHLFDRHKREMVLVPTAEEVFTDLGANEIKSYKQMPLNLYQIQFKFRDEFRPRFGVLRSREFIMKDAYTYDVDADGLQKSYMNMHNAYCRIFKRCGLDYVIVEAESGEIGGSGSHQFTVPCESGEDVIVYFEDGSRAWNLEKAPVDSLPKQKGKSSVPAVEEVHTPSAGTIEDVCNFLKCKPEDLIKTLIFSAGEETIVAIVRGDHELNLEKLTQAVGGKHLELADEAAIQKVTGAKVGFAGPFGLAEKVDKIFIDHSVAAMAVGITGANKTDYHIKNIVPGRDFALEGDNIKVLDLRIAREGDTYEGKKLLFKKGIEVGQIFKLWTKYSDKLGAKFIDENGQEKSCLMGCYGIGINRIAAAAIENGHDKDGIIFPISIAPFEVIVTSLNQDEEITAAAEKIYNQLLDKGVDVLFDDRPLRSGVKFKDADLIGIPVRVTVGKKTLADGNVEIKLRSERQSATVSLDSAADKVTEIVNSLKDKLKV